MHTTYPNYATHTDKVDLRTHTDDDTFLLSNSFLVINTDQLLLNLSTIKKYNKSIIAIVKSNAYGLGVDMISRYLQKEVEYLSFMYCEEAKKTFPNTPH